jgi:CheY-like chemotaxis protein
VALKVLLADDSMTAQNMGKKILTDAGYQVIAVSNGAQAMKKLASEKPDVVVLDVYMPGYTGLEVCERIRNSPETARMPVLLCVAKMEPFRSEEGDRVMADGVIIKPFEASDLVARIEALHDKLKAARAVQATPETSPGFGAIERTSQREEAPEVEEPRRASLDVPQEMAAAPAFGMELVSEAVSPAPESVSAPAGASVEFEIEHEREPVEITRDTGMTAAEGLSGVFEMTPSAPEPANVQEFDVVRSGEPPAEEEHPQQSQAAEETKAQAEEPVVAEVAEAAAEVPAVAESPEAMAEAPASYESSPAAFAPAAAPGEQAEYESNAVAVAEEAEAPPETSEFAVLPSAWSVQEVELDASEQTVSLEEEMRLALAVPVELQAAVEEPPSVEELAEAPPVQEYECKAEVAEPEAASVPEFAALSRDIEPPAPDFSETAAPTEWAPVEAAPEMMSPTVQEAPAAPEIAPAPEISFCAALPAPVEAAEFVDAAEPVKTVEPPDAAEQPSSLANHRLVQAIAAAFGGSGFAVDQSPRHEVDRGAVEEIVDRMLARLKPELVARVIDELDKK